METSSCTPYFHEFWLELVLGSAYTLVDRRDDATIESLPTACAALAALAADVVRELACTVRAGATVVHATVVQLRIQSLTRTRVPLPPTPEETDKTPKDVFSGGVLPGFMQYEPKKGKLKNPGVHTAYTAFR